MEVRTAAVLRNLADHRLLVLPPFEASVQRGIRQVVVDRRLIDAHVP